MYSSFQKLCRSLRGLMSLFKMTTLWTLCLCTMVLISVGGYIITVSGDQFTLITKRGNDEGSSLISSTTSQHLTEKPKSLPPILLTNDSRTYPAPVLAEVTSINAEKKIQFEFTISKDSSHGCDPNRKISCEIFEDAVMRECEKYYRKIQGFWYSNQDILEFKYDSIIIRQQVSFSYNDMRPEDRGLSPQEVYDRTIGPAVAEGSLGELKVLPRYNCNQTIDLTNLNGLLSYCDPYLWAKCIGGYAYCVSPCQYITCRNGGTCLQMEGSAWKCKCRTIKRGVFYFGSTCQNYINRPALIMALIFVLGMVLLVCYAVKKNGKKRKA